MTERKRNTRKNSKEGGITLIALIITIIVLLILAGVALATLTGDSGILSNAEKAALKTELAGIEEEASLIYNELMLAKYSGGTEEVSISNIANRLNQKGYTIQNVATSGEVTDITLDNSSLSIAPNGTATIKVTLEEEEKEESSYYAVIKGKYYKIAKANNGIKVEKTESEVSGGNTGELIAEVTEGSTVTVGEINGNVINITAGSTAGSSTITVTYGSITKTCTVAVKIEPTDTSVANSETTLFSTNYGTIEVIWLEGTTNKVSETPNSPANALTSNGESLIPVTFNATTSEWTELQTTDNQNNNWYDYNAGSQTRGADGKLVDNTSSNWANAMTENDSLFVWIPRYAYRITYYESETSTIPTGYYDGWGMWKAADGKVKYKLDDGIETVEHNGNKYIVHPAFMDDRNKTAKDAEGNIVQLEDYARGGWDSNLTGFWVAKFEMAGTGTTLNSTYGSASIGKQTIGAQYTSARQATYGYTGIKGADGHTSFMNSHMMKNSEWGAVAYLTHSQYGRNGREISVNNDGTTYYRGGGADRAYITNVAQSTTGNVYGVYDMSGNKFERTAVFNNTDTSGHFSTHGWTTATGLTTSSGSTRYATKYYNTTGSVAGNVIIYNYGKVGDATKEVNQGGAYKESSIDISYEWLNDYINLMEKYNPFVVRGGYYANGSGAGVFDLSCDKGADWDESKNFRVVLAQ